MSRPGFFSLTVNWLTRPFVGESSRPSNTTIFTRPWRGIKACQLRVLGGQLRLKSS